MEIRNINHSIAYCNEFRGFKWIEINNKLWKYPKLCAKVLAHEELHYNTDGILNNLKIDLFEATDFIKQLQLFGFTIRHPSALLGMSPILNTDNGWSVIWFNVFIWIICVVFIIILISMVMQTWV